MIYRMTLKDSADEMTFDLLEVPIVDKDIEGAVDNVTLDGNQYTDYLWLKKQFIQKWSILCDDEYTRLRGFYTRQFENADVPSYRLYYGNDIIRNSTLSGEYIQFSVEGVADGTMSLTQIDGNTTQQTYTGKNLLPMRNTTRTINDVTFTPRDDGSVLVNGTATAQTSYPLNINNTSQSKDVTLPAGTYTIDDGITASGVFVQAWYDVAGGSNQYSTGQFTTTGETHLGAYIRVNSGVNTNGVVVYPMLNTGSTAQPYEPYVGGIPAPNPSYPQPIQTVTGRQTITITGKNLWGGLAGSYSRSIDGIDFITNSDGTITASGLATSTAFSCSSSLASSNNIYTTLKAGTYYLSTESTLPSGAIARISKLTDGTTLAESPHSFTLTEDTDVYASLRIASGTNISSGITVKPMLELGSTATAYEPYQGQTLPVNLGKNLFDNSASATWNHGSTSVSSLSNGVRVSQIDSGTYRASGWVICRAEDFIGKTISLSAKMTPSSSNKGAMYIAFSDATGSSRTILKTGTSSGSISATISSVDQTKPYIAVALYSNYDGTGSNGCYVDYSELQLELGSATDYAPYFTPIELAKIGNYQDRIYKENGKWYIEKQVGKVVLDGSESYAYSSGNNWAYFYFATIGADACDSNSVGISNNFTRTAINSMASDTTLNGVFAISADKTYFAIRNTTLTSKAEYNTWLSTHPTTVYYALATPTTTEITNDTLVGELEALVDEAISVGQHNICTDTPNALPTLTFDLTEYLSQSTTIIPETAVRLTLTDGGVINACGCRKDVQLTMRETIE